MQKSKMRKSSSLAAFKIDFNPSQFEVGHSKIQSFLSKAPKPEARRFSTSNLAKVKTTIESSELQLLKRLNETYKRQNQQLQRQIEILKKASHPSMGIMPRKISIGAKDDKVAGYKQVIKNKIMNKSKYNSRVVTQCETGVFSSKEVSLGQCEPTIAQYYQSFSMGNRPNSKELQEIGKRFFKEYSQNYSKLTYMFGQTKDRTRASMTQQFEELLQIYKVPLIYNNNPKLLIKELSKEKTLAKRREKQPSICFETISPEDTVKKIESIFNRILKNPKLLNILRSNDLAKQFVSRFMDVPNSKLISKS